MPLYTYFWRQVQRVNTQNLKYQCITYFCVQHNIVLWFFFSVMKLAKSNYRATLKNEHLGELISTAFTNALSRFSGTRKSNTSLRLTNYCTSIKVTLTFFAIFVLTLQTGFEARWCFWFLRMTLLLNKFALPWFILCVTKHEWKRSIAANKTHFTANAPSKGAQMRSKTRLFA